MSNKPKACCANCKVGELSRGKASVLCKCVIPWESVPLSHFCEAYCGDGITPAQELEAANKRILELETERDKFKAFVGRVANIDYNYDDGGKGYKWSYAKDRVDEARALLRRESEENNGK